MARRDDWQTPPKLFNYIHSTVGFKVDAAANSVNHLLPDWYGPGSPIAEDALTVPLWASPAWCNPPYGRGINKWLEKFVEQQRLGNIIVALLPASTGTQWWWEWIVPNGEILFLVGRIPFIVPGRTKPSQPDHDSALVIFDPEPTPGNVAWLDWRAKMEEIDEG